MFIIFISLSALQEKYEEDDQKQVEAAKSAGHGEPTDSEIADDQSKLRRAKHHNKKTKQNQSPTPLDEEDKKAMSAIADQDGQSDNSNTEKQSSESQSPSSADKSPEEIVVGNKNRKSDGDSKPKTSYQSKAKRLLTRAKTSQRVIKSFSLSPTKEKEKEKETKKANEHTQSSVFAFGSTHKKNCCQYCQCGPKIWVDPKLLKRTDTSNGKYSGSSDSIHFNSSNNCNGMEERIRDISGIYVSDPLGKSFGAKLQTRIHQVEETMKERVMRFNKTPPSSLKSSFVNS